MIGTITLLLQMMREWVNEREKILIFLGAKSSRLTQGPLLMLSTILGYLSKKSNLWWLRSSRRLITPCYGCWENFCFIWTVGSEDFEQLLCKTLYL